MKLADKVHARFIRDRDRGICVICGSTVQPECGHLFTRAAHSTRWDYLPDGNCHCQCHACNMRHEEDAKPFTDWYIGKFGQAAYDALLARHNRVRRWSVGELEDLIRAMQ